MLERLKGYVQNPVFLFILWMGVGLACSLSLMMKGTYSNYVIFSQSFWHAISSSPLYVEYLQEQKDFFLYGISFTALISPFAVLPRPLGMILWCLVNCGFLYYAISKLDLKKWQFAVVILVSVNDVFTAVLSQQYSIGITAMIIFAYVLIEKEKDFWAALMIVLGTMTKLYGIVGLAFFLFSKHKMKLTGGLHRITGASFSDLWIIVPGMILFALPYLRVRQYGNESFRFLFLSSALLFMVLFSTGTETYGYLTAMIAVGIWYVKTPTKAATPILNLSLLIFCILLTSLSTTDLFPRFIRAEYVKPYALKALPCTLIWLKIVWEQLTQDFARPSD